MTDRSVSRGPYVFFSGSQGGTIEREGEDETAYTDLWWPMKPNPKYSPDDGDSRQYFDFALDNRRIAIKVGSNWMITYDAIHRSRVEPLVGPFTFEEALDYIITIHAVENVEVRDGV